MTSIASNNDQFKINNDSIVSGLQNLFNSHLNIILKDIAECNSLELEDLYNKYIYNNFTNMDMSMPTFSKKTRRKNKSVAKIELCMARKADLCQCTRRRKNNTDYCGKHSGILKYGRIDDEDKYSNTEQFIQCKPITIDGTEYLIDSNRVVYIHDVDNPSIIGRLDEHDDLILLSSDNR